MIVTVHVIKEPSTANRWLASFMYNGDAIDEFFVTAESGEGAQRAALERWQSSIVFIKKCDA